MGVYIKEDNKLWTQGVPYVISDDEKTKQIAGRLKGLIDAFNTAVERIIFFPRKDEANYAAFKITGGNAPIGIQGGKQEINFEWENLYHEMGHCVGLGHEHLRGDFPLMHLLNDWEKELHARNAPKYKSVGQYNPASMMTYRLTMIPSAMLEKAIELSGKIPNQKKNKELAKVNVKDSDVELVKKYWTTGNNMALDGADIVLIRTLCKDAAPLPES